MIKRKEDETKRFLKLNLQYFAEGDPQDDPQGGQDDPQDLEGGQDAPGTGTEPGQNGNQDEDVTITMTQDKLDKIIADRLARERKKQEEKEQQLRDEAERKRLKENEEYKDLAEKLQAKLDAQQAEVLDVKKSTLLQQAGYTEEQAELLKGTLQGESDEELKSSVDQLTKTISPKKSYGDPNPGNGRKQTPTKIDGEEVGKSAWERIKGKMHR